MVKIRDVATRLSDLIGTPYINQDEVSALDKTLGWFGFAAMYAGAAECLARERPELELPWQQLAGHAVECAIKGCLQSVNHSPPTSHDLVKLFETAESLQFSLYEPDLVLIFMISRNYSKDSGTNTRFKARYPTQSHEPIQHSQRPSTRPSQLIAELRRQALARLGKYEHEA